MDQSIHDVRRSNWLNIVNECQQILSKYDGEAMAR